MEQLVQALINGLVSGSIYALMAIGFTLIFGIMHVVNLAHGELYMLGAFSTFFLTTLYHFNFFAALLMALLIVGVLGFFIERIVFNPLRQRANPVLNTLLASIGLSIFISNLVTQAVGSDMRSIPPPFSVSTVQLFGLSVSVQRLVVLFVTLLLVVALFLMIKYTKFGKAMRATSQDRDAAALMGVNIRLIYGLTFALSAGLAAVAGGLIGSLYVVEPNMGLVPALKAFIIVILGGMGSVVGALVGSLILAYAETFTTLFAAASLQDLVGFIILILVLLLRPNGLFGGGKIS